MATTTLRQVGIEEEFALLDPETALPVPGAAARMVLAAPADAPLEHEFLNSQVEISTPPLRDLDAAYGHLARLRTGAAELARAHGLRLAPTGTPPLALASSEPAQVTPSERYLSIADDARQLARAHYVNGQHVHVSLESPEEGIRAINRLARWAPLLIAMTANSPCCGGSDTGFHSWRHIVGRAWPLNHYPEPFASVDAYRHRLDRLVRSGMVRDERLVSWLVRLSPRYPTVEIRLADTQLTAEHAVGFAAVVRALVEALVSTDGGREPHAGIAMEEIHQALWQAARDGLSGSLIDPHSGLAVRASEWLQELAETIAPQLERSGDSERVARYLAALAAGGNDAATQRNAYARGGVRELLDLYAASIRPETSATAPRHSASTLKT